MMKHPDGFQVLVALEQFVNTLIGGWADETLSGRAHRRNFGNKMTKLIIILRGD